LHVRPCPKDGGMNIELIVRPDCNQKCEYCYIAKYGHKSYPIEERVSNEEILKNLDSFLDYIYNDREYFVGDWELFAGDMFYDGLYFDLLDVFYKYISVEYEKHTNLYLDPHIHIFAPINFSFIENEEYVKKFDEYFFKFQKIGVDLGFSCSTDGKYAVSTREKRTLSDDYFDKIFTFMKKYHHRPHPMIAAVNIENWIENYDWWREQFKKYFYEDPTDFLPMMLEVRNDDWT